MVAQRSRLHKKSQVSKHSVKSLIPAIAARSHEIDPIEMKEMK